MLCGLLILLFYFWNFKDKLNMNKKNTCKLLSKMLWIKNNKTCKQIVLL